jgi:hypothetical protein
MTDLYSLRVTLLPNVIFQQVHEEAVLLDMTSEQYFALNELGMRTWQLLSEGMDFSKIIQQLLKEYEVDEVSLCNDISNWIHELAGLGLVQVTSDAP